MEISSVPKLCEHLISSAIQRCRMSEDLCRLSVVLKRSPPPDPPTLARISISDTGAGSSLEELQNLKFTAACISAENWDGVISLTTTSISDDQIFQYHFNFNEVASARRLIKLPSCPKNGAKFSGSEASLSAFTSADELLAKITPFFHKMQVLKIPKVAVELAIEHVESPGSLSQQFILADECVSSLTNIRRLTSGFEDYVYKHRNRLEHKCLSCFPSCDHLKLGCGTVCREESRRSTELMTEAVIIISEISEASVPCLQANEANSEVLFFKNFLVCTPPKSALLALTSIDWKSYGLALKSIVEQDGHAMLEWENLPAYAQATPVSTKQKNQIDRNLMKNAIKLALDDLKENHAGALLSERAAKICGYAPDLARTIAGLILSSNDSNFQEECFSLLGFQSHKNVGEAVEACIREKIVSVIELNDRKPLKSKEAAPFLFDDECIQNSDFQEDQYDHEEAYNSLDL